MTKICHVTSVHCTDDARIFHKECVSLAKAGCEVYLVGKGESRVESGVHVVGVGENSGGRLKRMLGFSKKVYQAALALDAEIYHLHDPELLPYAKKLKKKGKKVIFDSHEKYSDLLTSKPYLPRFAAGFIAKLYESYEKSVLKKIDAVIFPCTMGGKDPFEGLCKRTAIISNAAILDEFYNRYDPDAEKLPESVCYVGSISAERGVDHDILAAHRANARFLLAGPFSPPSFEETCKKMPEYSCVEYQGKLGRKEVTELLSRSMIGLFTLKDRGQYFKIDTFGVKVFEYMSMALPVVLSNSDYNVKMAETYRFGICVDPENPDEIANAIRYLLDNPEKAREMGENGRRAIHEEFHWGVEEKKLIALYENI